MPSFKSFRSGFCFNVVIAVVVKKTSYHRGNTHYGRDQTDEHPSYTVASVAPPTASCDRTTLASSQPQVAHKLYGSGRDVVVLDDRRAAEHQTEWQAVSQIVVDLPRYEAMKQRLVCVLQWTCPMNCHQTTCSSSACRSTQSTCNISFPHDCTECTMLINICNHLPASDHLALADRWLQMFTVQVHLQPGNERMSD